MNQFKQFKSGKLNIKFQFFAFVLITIFSISKINAQTTFYTIGNSFSDHINNGFTDVALSLGEYIDFGRHMVPGAPLNFILNNPNAGITSQGSYDEALPNKSWDFVSMQPWDNSVSSYSYAADSMATLTYMGNQDAIMLVLATAKWTSLGNDNIGDYYNGFFSEGINNQGSKIYFEALADTLKKNHPGKTVAIIPVQHIFAEVDRRLLAGETIPEVDSLQNFYASSTNDHFNAKGRYLGQLAAYCVMFAKAPTNATLNFSSYSVSQEFAEYAWDLVWDVVSSEPYCQLVADPTIPVANLSANTFKGDAPLSISFDGSGSYDTDGTITSYEWDFGDGSSSTGSTVSHSYSAGVYLVKLTVTDNDGKISTTSDYVVVNDNSISDTIYLEAECADIGTDWEMLESDAYSMGIAYHVQPGLNNTYLATNAETARIRFTFEVPSTGSYNLFARVSAPTGNDDSFFVRANNGSWVTWNNIGDGTSNMIWSEFSEVLSLTAGENIIDIEYREDGTVLDKLFITESSTAPTGMGLPSLNCITDEEAPTTPANLSSSDTLVNGVTLSWDVATDNMGVSIYEVYKDGTLSAASPINEYKISGLAPSTTYSFTVKAKDAEGNLSDASIAEVITTLDNHAPVAVVVMDVDSGAAPLVVNFLGGNSYDNDPGDVVIGYDWDFGDGNTYGSINGLSHTYTSPGTYIVSMGAIDLFGLRTETTDTIEVTGVAVPTYDIEFTINDGTNPLFEATVTLNSNDVITNVSGIALFEDLIDGNYSYSVSLAGYNTSTGSVTVSGSNVTQNITLTAIAAPTYNVTFVVNHGTNPTSDATVTFNGSDVKTDAFGNANFEDINNGTYAYSITSSGYETFTGSVTVSGSNVTENISLTALSTATAPAPPTNLTASETTSYGCKLFWTPSSDDENVTAYLIYQNNELIAQLSDTLYSVSNLLPETSYTFYVKATDAQDSISVSSNEVIIVTLPIDIVDNLNNTNSPDFFIYPNPANEMVTIKTLNSDISISILDIKGNVMIKVQSFEDLVNINTAGLKTGLYIIKAESEGNINLKKLIIY